MPAIQSSGRGNYGSVGELLLASRRTCRRPATQMANAKSRRPLSRLPAKYLPFQTTATRLNRQPSGPRKETSTPTPILTHPNPHNYDAPSVQVLRPLGPLPAHGARSLGAHPDPAAANPPSHHLRRARRPQPRCPPGPDRRRIPRTRPHGPDGQHRCVRSSSPHPPPPSQKSSG